MKLYDIRYYQPKDRHRLIQFLDKYWRKNHIIATSEKVFDFQHKFDDRYTFVIAENKETKEFDAVYGYILTHKYDESRQIPNVAWGAIWKVRDDVKNAEIDSLGLGLLRFILKNEDIVTFASSGISEKHKEIAKGLGFVMGEMTHYYIANISKEVYAIAENLKKPVFQQNNVRLTWVEWINDINVTNTLNPFKNYNYFIHRYWKHPVYAYRLLGAYISGELRLLMVVRKQVVEDSCCLRIVDIIGSEYELRNISLEMQKILIEENAEYIDCWNYGIDKNIFSTLGFEEVSGNTIVPDYFAPFERKNIRIEIDSLEQDLPIVIFKGDGDQDRPNSEIRKKW